MHLQWSNDYWWYLILMIPLVIVAWLALRASDKEKARDKKLAATYPLYTEWKRLMDRWRAFTMVAFGITMIPSSLASEYPVLRPVLGWVLPFIFFIWAPAEVCAVVLWAGRRNDWRSYMCNIWRTLLIATALLAVYSRIREVAEGLPLMVKWAQAAAGMALSPVFLRLSGFYELDKFRLEPAPKSVILGPHGEEL